MKTVLILCVMIAFCIPAFAKDRRTELIDAVDFAVKTLETKGNAGLAELKMYRFSNGEGYVYVGDTNGYILMHPVAPELLGKDCTAIKDAKGKFFGAEMVAKATKQGSGWTSYWWPNAKKNNIPELKCAFYRVTTMDGKKVIVYAGLYGVGNCE